MVGFVSAVWLAISKHKLATALAGGISALVVLIASGIVDTQVTPRVWSAIANAANAGNLAADVDRLSAKVAGLTQERDALASTVKTLSAENDGLSQASRSDMDKIRGLSIQLAETAVRTETVRLPFFTEFACNELVEAWAWKNSSKFTTDKTNKSRKYITFNGAVYETLCITLDGNMQSVLAISFLDGLHEGNSKIYKDLVIESKVAYNAYLDDKKKALSTWFYYFPATDLFSVTVTISDAEKAAHQKEQIIPSSVRDYFQKKYKAEIGFSTLTKPNNAIQYLGNFYLPGLQLTFNIPAKDDPEVAENVYSILVFAISHHVDGRNVWSPDEIAGLIAGIPGVKMEGDDP